MPLSAFVLLVVIALILAILSIIRPQWPLIPIATILICVALLIRTAG